MKNKYNRVWACMLPAVARRKKNQTSNIKRHRGTEGQRHEVLPLCSFAPLLLCPFAPIFAFCILIFALVSPGLGQDTTAAGPQDTWTKYQIILQRNIFSRQRGPIRQSQLSERPRTVVTPNPESYFLLKGIVQEGDKFIAFLEDTRGSAVLKLREGDSVARGVVKNFTLDAIEYQLADRMISVPLGRDLEGGQGTITMNRLLELSATPSPAGEQKGASAEPAPSGDEAEILKKLMEQRKQQLGQ